MLEEAMLSHFATSSKPTEIYSIPATSSDGALRELVPLRESLAAPAVVEAGSSALELDGGASCCVWQGDVSAFAMPVVAVPTATSEAAAMESIAEKRSRIFFRVLHADASRAKVANVAPAAGRRLQRRTMAVTLHQGLESYTSSAKISFHPVRSMESSPIMTMVGLGGSIADLGETCERWSQPDKILYTLQDTSFDKDVADILTSCVSQRAFESENRCATLPLNSAAASVAALLSDGIMVRSSSGYAMTRYGVSKLGMVLDLKEPQRVFQVRGHLALKNLTGFELLSIMNKSEPRWSWRALGTKPRPAYTAGAELVWYSSKGARTPNVLYLRSLLSASPGKPLEGVTVEHGRSELCNFR